MPTAFHLVASLVLAMWAIRLFVIGHDACHGSYTASPLLNRWIGRIAFLPALTPFTLWEIGHNIAHHSYNNLRSTDFVWTPLAPEDYAKLSKGQQWLYRFYRSGWAPGFYYLCEIWWKKLILLDCSNLPARKALFRKDRLLVGGFGLCWTGTLAGSAAYTGQSIGLSLLLGFILPFFLWSCAAGFAVYVQHTHPDVRWYDDKVKWGADRAHLTATAHIELPAKLGGFFHNILDHTAHHVDMSVPMTQLPRGQQELSDRFESLVVRQPFSWRWYFQTARHCQLYDYKKQQWVRPGDNLPIA